MSEKEKATIKKMSEIFDKLPPDKQQYFNGYAEGVADMVAAGVEAAPHVNQQSRNI